MTKSRQQDDRTGQRAACNHGTQGITQPRQETTSMTSEQPTATATSLRRPPVRQSPLVRSDRRHTFDVFVRTIGIWWPVTPFSRGRDRVRDVTFEQREGGRVYESWLDGTTVDWGTLLAWEPPERFIMTWNFTSVATEVE